MWRLTKNIDRETTYTNEIEFRKVKSKHFQTFEV